MKKITESAVSIDEIIDGKKAKIQKNRNIGSMLFDFAFVAAIFCLFVFVVFGFAAVNGNSMYPALRDGDLVMLYRLEKTYKAEDVIAFKLDDTEYVKRIVAVAGDTVNIDDESGYLIVNGSVMNNDILFSTKSLGEAVTFPYTVPENSVFVLGDNREHSTDSRVFSAIPLDCIKGKVMLVIRSRII